MIGDVLFDESIFRGDCIYRDNYFESSKNGFISSVQHRAMCCGSGHDDGLDAVILQYLLEIGAKKLIRSGLDIRLFADWSHIRQGIADGPLLARTCANAVNDEHIIGACRRKNKSC